VKYKVLHTQRKPKYHPNDITHRNNPTQGIYLKSENKDEYWVNVSIPKGSSLGVKPGDFVYIEADDPWAKTVELSQITKEEYE